MEVREFRFTFSLTAAHTSCHSFPSGLFWALPRRPPKAIVFDAANSEHLDFILHTAHLFANIYSIPDKTFDRIQVAKVRLEGLTLMNSAHLGVYRWQQMLQWPNLKRKETNTWKRMNKPPRTSPTPNLTRNPPQSCRPRSVTLSLPNLKRPLLLPLLEFASPLFFPSPIPRRSDFAFLGIVGKA